MKQKANGTTNIPSTTDRMLIGALRGHVYRCGLHEVPMGTQWAHGAQGGPLLIMDADIAASPALRRYRYISPRSGDLKKKDFSQFSDYFSEFNKKCFLSA